MNKVDLSPTSVEAIEPEPRERPSSLLTAAAEAFFLNEANRGHAGRNDVESPIASIEAGLRSAHHEAARSLPLVHGTGLRVLDVGCSWGPIAFALSCSSRVATVVGIDLETEAVSLARAIGQTTLVDSSAAGKVTFVQGAAEELPFDSGTFDLVVCHTVIEHVGNVERCLLEMHRVLKVGGAIHLQAPNYIWPLEPHLQLWMPPLGPKSLVKLLARITRKNAEFVDHLQFVNPFLLERLFRAHSMRFENIYLRKLEKILLAGSFESIVGLKRLIPLLKVLKAVGITPAVYRAATALGCYPSVDYAISK